MLLQAMPRAFEIADADGMTPLHLACQRTSDLAMVATILSYKKDNINQASTSLGSHIKQNLTSLFNRYENVAF